MELSRAERQSTVNELLAGLEHEINQPLAAASNFARASVQGLQSGGHVKPEQLIDWMEKSAEQAERAAQIVARLVDSVLQDPIEPRVNFDLNRVIENLAGDVMVDGYADDSQGPVPTLELDESISIIWGHKIQIELVLFNLIRNAMEAMQDLPPQDRLLIIRTSQQQDHVEVTVSDNGHGVPNEKMVRLFTPLFSTEDKWDEAWVGQWDEQLWNPTTAKLTAVSKPGGGSSFTFSLPIKMEKETL